MPKIIVTLVEANFEKEKKGSEPDAFCTISVTDKVGYKSKSVRRFTPSWNESFHAEVETVPSEIIIECLSRGRLTDDFLGRVSIPLPPTNELVDKWFDLAPKEGKKEKISGQLHVQLLVQPDFGTEQQYKQVEKRFVDAVDPSIYEALDTIERQRQEVLFELVTTEAGYVADLNTIVQVFLEPLRARQLLTKEEIGKVFSNIEAIVPNNTNFLKELQRRHESLVIKEVGDLLLETADLLKLYAIYCSNQPIVPGLVEEYKKREEFSNFLNETPVLAALRGLTFESFLIKPLQRVCKYPLLLKELLRYTPENHPDFPALNEAILKIKGIVDQINERTRQVESVLKLKAIAKNLVFGKDEKWKDFNLVQMNRVLVREGKARVSSPNKAKYDAVLFLFSDIILITAPTKKGTYQVKQEVQVMTASITDLHDSELFEVEINDKSYTIQMSSKDEKKIWLSEISKLARKSRSETEGRLKASSNSNSTPRVLAPPASPRSSSMSGSTPSSPVTRERVGSRVVPVTPSPLGQSSTDSSPSAGTPIAQSIPVTKIESFENIPVVSWSDQPSPNRVKDALEKEKAARQAAEIACTNLKEQIRVLERANASLEDEVASLKAAISAAEQRYGIVIPLVAPSAAEIAVELELARQKEAEAAEEERRRREEEEAQERERLELQRQEEEREQARKLQEEQERLEREARERAEAERIQNERLKEIEKILAANDWDEDKLLDEWETAIGQMWGGVAPDEQSEKKKDDTEKPATSSESESKARLEQQQKEPEQQPEEAAEPEQELRHEQKQEEQVVQESQEKVEAPPTYEPKPIEIDVSDVPVTDPLETEAAIEETSKPEEEQPKAVESPRPPAVEEISKPETPRKQESPREAPTTDSQDSAPVTEESATPSEPETSPAPVPTPDPVPAPAVEPSTEAAAATATASAETPSSTPEPEPAAEDTTPPATATTTSTSTTTPTPTTPPLTTTTTTTPTTTEPEPKNEPAEATSVHPEQPKEEKVGPTAGKVKSIPLPATKGHAGSQKETTSSDVKELERKQVLLAALNKLEGKLKDVAVRSGGQVPARVRVAAEQASTPPSLPRTPSTGNIRKGAPTSPSPSASPPPTRLNTSSSGSNLSTRAQEKAPLISVAGSSSPPSAPSASGGEEGTPGVSPRPATLQTSSSFLRTVGKSTSGAQAGNSLEKLLLAMIKDQQ